MGAGGAEAHGRLFHLQRPRGRERAASSFAFFFPSEYRLLELDICVDAIVLNIFAAILISERAMHSQILVLFAPSLERNLSIRLSPQRMPSFIKS